VPLVLILVYICQRGIPGLLHGFIDSDPTVANSRSLLFGALIGTIEQVLLAAVIAIPIGLFTAIYLVEYGRGGLARAVTFFVDVMTGVPSIVAGLFVYTFLLLGSDARPFGFAGSLGLCILMIPVVVRSSEEMLRLVPRDLRDAAYALGVPKWRTISKIVLPTALSGLITSGLLAVARIAGETAPLILLVGYSQFRNWNPFSGDQATLPMMVWDQLGKRTGGIGSANLAFGAGLLLVLFILVLNVVARLAANRAKPKSR
jgi:phosphate transport system permease protein